MSVVFDFPMPIRVVCNLVRYCSCTSVVVKLIIFLHLQPHYVILIQDEMVNIGSNFLGIMAKLRDTWVDAEEKEHITDQNQLQNQLI